MDDTLSLGVQGFYLGLGMGTWLTQVELIPRGPGPPP